MLAGVPGDAASSPWAQAALGTGGLFSLLAGVNVVIIGWAALDFSWRWRQEALREKEGSRAALPAAAAAAAASGHSAPGATAVAPSVEAAASEGNVVPVVPPP